MGLGLVQPIVGPKANCLSNELTGKSEVDLGGFARSTALSGLPDGKMSARR